MRFEKWSNWIHVKKKEGYPITLHDINLMLFDTDLNDAEFRSLITEIFYQE